ncbi:MAG: lysophospholipid acyltransferase family protein [Bryobacterales bacterium]|nr:lysophospholipid acyltransferase family protein [Bryobacterales bacterium]
MPSPQPRRGRPRPGAARPLPPRPRAAPHSLPPGRPPPPRLRRVADRNLDLALPGTPHAEIIDGCFESLARVVAMLASFPDIDKSNIHSLIRYEGFEHFEAAKRTGKGVLFATAHLGNWEFSAFAHALMAEPMSFVVRPLDNPMLDDLASRYRTLSGNNLIGRGKDFLRPSSPPSTATKPSAS